MRGAGLTRLAALLPLLLGCAGPGRAPEFEAMAAREIAAHPRRYTFGDGRAVLISRDGVPRGLIWGTMHVAYGDDTALPRPVRDRFSEASSLLVEYDYGQMPRADRLRHQRRWAAASLGADQAALARLDPATRAALDGANLPAGSLSRYSLLGLSRLVTARANRGAPASPTPQIGQVDGLLARFAQNRGIPVRSLEDERHPLDVLYGGDPNGPEAASDLRSALLCANDVPEFGRWAQAAYAQGRVAALNAAATAFCADPSEAPLMDRMRERVFTARNAVMAERIDAALAQPGFHFVAVGAGHLLGADGVPALLQARGWTVTPCPGDRC